MSNENNYTFFIHLLEKLSDKSPIIEVVNNVKNKIKSAHDIKIISHIDSYSTNTKELTHTYFLRLKRHKNIEQEIIGFRESVSNLQKTSIEALKLIILQVDNYVITGWYSDNEIICCFYNRPTRKPHS